MSNTVTSEAGFVLNRPVYREKVGSLSIALVPYVPCEHAVNSDENKNEKLLSPGLTKILDTQGLEFCDKKGSNLRYGENSAYPIIIDPRAIEAKVKTQHLWGPGPSMPINYDITRRIYEELHKKLNRGAGYGIETVHQLTSRLTEERLVTDCTMNSKSARQR